MRKWAFFLSVIAAVGLIGCGGSGGGNANVTTGTGGTTGRVAQGVNIPNVPGLLDTYLLPTQGRQSISYFTQIGNLVYTDVNGNSTALENTQTILPVTLNLSSVSQNPLNYPLDVTVPSIGSSLPATSRQFNQLNIFFNDFYTSDNANPTPPIEVTTATQLSVFQGRTTAVQLYLNDGEFDFSQTPPAFNQAVFNAQNDIPQTSLLGGFLADYLSIDISKVATPLIMSNGQTAGRLFISGDNYAVSSGTPTNKGGLYFEVLTAFGVFTGQVFGPISSSSLPTQTYALSQPNILSLTNPGNVTSLEGLWYDYSQRISAADTTLMIAFPSTGDGSTQELALVQHAGTTFQNVYFGSINYAAAGGPTFSAFPVSTLESGLATGAISGTVSGVVDGNGNTISTKVSSWWRLVRSGKFTITAGSGSGFASTGRVVVYRV